MTTLESAGGGGLSPKVPSPLDPPLYLPIPIDLPLPTYTHTYLRIRAYEQTGRQTEEPNSGPHLSLYVRCFLLIALYCSKWYSRPTFDGESPAKARYHRPEHPPPQATNVKISASVEFDHTCCLLPFLLVGSCNRV